MADIIRAQTEAERADFLLAGTKDYKTVFVQLLMKAEKEHQSQNLYTPYDRNGARFNFEDSDRKLIDDSIRSTGTVDVNKILDYVKNFDFKKYTSINRWELVGEKPVFEKIIVNGVAHKQQTGVWMEYRHKSFNNIHESVEVPLDIYNEKFKNKKAKKVVEATPNETLPGSSPSIGDALNK